MSGIAVLCDNRRMFEVWAHQHAALAGEFNRMTWRTERAYPVTIESDAWGTDPDLVTMFGILPERLFAAKRYL